MKLLFLIVAISALLVAWKLWRSRRENARQPKVAVRAQVIAAERRQTMSRRTGLDVTFHGVFMTEDGQKLEFQLKKPMCDRLRCGDWGTLYYQGTRFDDFR